jgi:hypothetical protein
VIGNSNYANLRKLSNPTNDPHSIADVLQKLGYKTQLLLLSRAPNGNFVFG